MQTWVRSAVVVLLGTALSCGGSSDPGAPDASALTRDGGSPQASCAEEGTQPGEATYYTTADGSGNCSFPASPADLFVGAMNKTDYQDAAACGACATLRGPLGEVTVRIVDQCPECSPGDIDLSPQAFDRIAARASGRVAISWQYAPCTLTGPVRYHFKEGSSQWWTAVQVRNHHQRISRFEVEKDGRFVAVARTAYNYFVDAQGMGPGPYTFRVTDVYGHQIVDRAIALRVDAEVAGSGQFPACDAD